MELETASNEEIAEELIRRAVAVPGSGVILIYSRPVQQHIKATEWSLRTGGDPVVLLGLTVLIGQNINKAINQEG